MSTTELVIMGVLFLILLGVQFVVLRTLINSGNAEVVFDSNQFNELANSALAHNNEQFLSLANERFERQHSEAENQLDSRKKEIENLLQPLTQQITRLEAENKEMEKARN